MANSFLLFALLKKHTVYCLFIVSLVHRCDFFLLFVACTVLNSLFIKLNWSVSPFPSIRIPINELNQLEIARRVICDPNAPYLIARRTWI